MARGIAVGANGREDYKGLLMSYDPPRDTSSSMWFHGDRWLSFNMMQTGHGPADFARCWMKVPNDYTRSHVEPVLDGESLDEDRPIVSACPAFSDIPRTRMSGSEPGGTSSPAPSD